ncbi:diguanylate cyclase (GGDEF)-like protein [Undibacterium pigrum]|uniref:diguanylate cyclase n=2 Tax=Undibacterium pigrum TaxID=401470 RepID=A0A318J307_9BURK|nr:diguanylate cyclase (GGDEF)-like protein [Undibacterium pigrum]
MESMMPAPLDEEPDQAQSALLELQSENQALRARLDSLLELAHRNQNIMARHQSFDLKIIGANSFRELITNIFSALAVTSELDVVSLVLFDKLGDLQQMLSDLKIDLNEFPHLIFLRHEVELSQPETALRKPQLGLYQSLAYSSYFSSFNKKPASIAIIPMRRQGRLIGCLNLGSFKADRFQPNMATDFIERLGSIIAICLENVINNERLTYIGLTDPLTNVSNRRYVEQRMLEEIARARRQRYSIACMYLDIDFFKQINDRYGHQGGDDVLKEVAKRIKDELRLSDTLGRFGGEEFVVVLVNTNLHDAIQVAERIRKSIAGNEFVLSESGTCQATISIGLTTIDENSNYDDASSIARDLVLRADRALYQAKNGGRNQVRCF